jgi:hypothetical protein
VDAVLNLGATVPRVVVTLPDDAYVFDTFESIKQFVAEGKQQIVHLIFEAQVAPPYPRHGIIEFGDGQDILYVDGEGQWWLYDETTRLTGKTVMLNVTCKVVNVLLTIDV